MPLFLNTKYTAGSVIYSNGLILTQDNSNFFYDDTNHRLSIGTSSPILGKLESRATSGAQIVSSYDGSNYLTITVGSTGIATLAPNGSGANVVATGSNFGLDNAKAIQFKDTGGTYQTVLTLFSDSNVYLDNRSTGGIYLRTNGSVNTAIFSATGTFAIGNSGTALGKLESRATSGAQIVGSYDGSNYLTITTGSAGSTTLALTGTSPIFTFSQNTVMSGTLRVGANSGGSGTTGDIVTRRSATTGALYFGDSTANFLYFNATSYSLGTGTFVVGNGGNSALANIESRSTTTQYMSSYDASNYMTITTGSVGSTTFDLTGTSPKFTFNQNVGIGVAAGAITLTVAPATDSNGIMVARRASGANASSYWGLFVQNPAANDYIVFGQNNSSGTSVLGWLAANDGFISYPGSTRFAIGNTHPSLTFTSGNNLQLGGDSTSATLAGATADTVSLAAVDASAGHRRLYLQSEAGSVISLGDDRLNFAATTGYLSIGGTDITTINATGLGVLTTPRQMLSIGSYLDIYAGSGNSPTVPSIRGSSSNNVIINGFSTGAVYLNFDSGNNVFSCAGASTTSSGNFVHGLGSLPSGSPVYNFCLAGGATSPVLGTATADMICMAAVDASAGHRRLYIQSEAGSVISLGDDRLNFAASTGIVSIGGTDVIGIKATSLTVGHQGTALGTLESRATSGAQIASSYDGSNYMTVTTGSAGSTTFALTGTTPTFSFSQSVGIGLSSPAEALEVKGTIRATSSDGVNIVGITAGTFGNPMVISASEGVGGGLQRSGRFAALNNAGAVDLAIQWNSTTQTAGTNPYAASGWTTGLIVKGDTGKVGIGTSSPSAELHTLSTTEQLRIGYDASNYMSVTTGSAGSTTFTLTGTTPFFTFGSGTDTPHVAGTVVIQNGANTNLCVRDSTNHVEWECQCSSTGVIIGAATTHSLFIRSDNVTAITVDTSQKVGVGTTPSARLHTLSTTEQLRVGYDASNYMSVTVASAGSTTFALTGTTPYFHFSQSVAIGTTSAPNSRLTIVSSSQTAASQSNWLELTTGTGATTDNKLVFGVLDANYGWIQATHPGTGALNLILNANGGKVAVGNTTPNSNFSVTAASQNNVTSQSNFFELTTGTGATTDNKLIMGVQDATSGWIQAIHPGTGFLPLYLNAWGGLVTNTSNANNDGSHGIDGMGLSWEVTSGGGSGGYIAGFVNSLNGSSADGVFIKCFRSDTSQLHVVANNTESRFWLAGTSCYLFTSAFPVSATYNLVIGGPATSPVLGATTADAVSLAAVDASAGHRRLYIQSEAGSAISLGDDRLNFAASTGYLSIGGTDVVTMTSTTIGLTTVTSGTWHGTPITSAYIQNSGQMILQGAW